MLRTVTAIVAESLPAFRAAVMRLLTYNFGLHVLHAARGSEELLALAESQRPALMVIDHDTPETDVGEVLYSIRARSPQTRVVLSAMDFGHPDILRASRAGARGCVLKSDSPDELLFTIAEVLAGRVAFSSRLQKTAEALGICGSSRRHAAAAQGALTRRETQVLACLARGLSVKEVAATLEVSAKTVEGHKASIMVKLDIHDRVLLSHYAIREGLVSV